MRDETLPIVEVTLDYSGAVRAAWHNFRNFRLPAADRLEAILARLSYKPADEEKLLAIAEMEKWTHSSWWSLDTNPELKRLSDEIDKTWVFRDKYTNRWSVVYGLASRAGDGTISADVGSTELKLESVVARLQKPGRLRLGRLIEKAVSERAVVYLLPLECYRGNLDDVSGAKHAWRTAALNNGVLSPHSWTQDSASPNGRHWPSWSEFVNGGLLVFCPVIHGSAEPASDADEPSLPAGIKAAELL